MKIEILGIKIDNLAPDESVEYIVGRIRRAEKTFIATPNPEMLVLAHKNLLFKDALNAADLAVPDGFGLVLAAKALSLPLKQKVSGTDLVEALIRRHGEELRVYLLGAGEGIGEKAAGYLKILNPNLKVAGVLSGEKLDLNGHFKDEEIILESIRTSGANLLLVALGQIKQETWIYRNLQNLPNVAAIGIGGALDFYAGRVKRAPKILQRLGLEWLWRLLLEPKRFWRIINAVIVFPYLVIKYERK